MVRNSKELVIIDDDESINDLVESHLEETDWQLTFFSDEDQGLAYLASHSPNTLVVDIRMPKLDGDQVLEELTNYDKSGDTRVLVWSSVEPPEVIWQKFRKFDATFVLKEKMDHKENFLLLLSGSK